jgi:hypothetical protein
VAEVERIRLALEATAPNTEPSRVAVDKDAACFLVRRYFFSNLYDRLSTRPFLDAAEKRWIVYQLLHVRSLIDCGLCGCLLEVVTGRYGVPRKQCLPRRHQD